MPYLRTKDGTNIYYESQGKGTPLVFIHGLGASSTMYKPQVEYFKNFFEVILIDLRGNGNSGRLDCEFERVLGVQINDIKEILNFLKIEEAIFVGVSYGGVVIQKLAITYPEIVKALVIVDSYCDTSIDSVQKLFGVMGAKQTWILHIPKKWLARLTKASYKRWKLASEEMERVLLNLRKHEATIQRKAINHLKFNRQLNSLEVPSLCLVGDHTKLGVQMMKQVARHIKQSEFCVIKDSFDPSNLCQPHVFNETVHKFLSKI
ncbi:alpha/beta fold hydrolase [Ureibacillus aquaedulcis]|uniref:Alpha/beta hydrolase n=1 Tax=Ureibacillus aquaedulcis TaxID=3058421 RepID=A0ABT8GTI0_9BACL|nr:alpha/beta hydrolase [Ureibacillus sp. BA0131]MDN4494720.1 alpha/beta hydrolase [Ureibacillus sp. BA0131]